MKADNGSTKMEDIRKKESNLFGKVVAVENIKVDAVENINHTLFETYKVAAKAATSRAIYNHLKIMDFPARDNNSG